MRQDRPGHRQRPVRKPFAAQAPRPGDLLENGDAPLRLRSPPLQPLTVLLGAGANGGAVARASAVWNKLWIILVLSPEQQASTAAERWRLAENRARLGFTETVAFSTS